MKKVKFAAAVVGLFLVSAGITTAVLMLVDNARRTLDALDFER